LFSTVGAAESSAVSSAVSTPETASDSAAMFTADVAGSEHTTAPQQPEQVPSVLDTHAYDQSAAVIENDSRLL
jgi:hypothetical protein